eukprot:5251474-Pyramimonas_sp.AAC.1
MGPRHPWGAAICVIVATFEGCWGGASTVGTHGGFKLNLAIPGGLRYVKLSPLSSPAGEPSTV